MFWEILNIASGVIVALIIAFKLGAYADHFNTPERLGMGMIGGGMILRIGPILTKNWDGRSPFDDWSVTLLHFGLAIYFIGRLLRRELIGHRVTP